MSGSGRTRYLALAVGVFSQAAQVLVFREVMSATRGSELVWGLVLAGSLLWTGAGAAVAGAMPASRSWEGRAARLRLVACAAGPVLAAELALVRMLGSWGGALGGEVMSFDRASALALLAPLPAGSLAGAAFSLVLACSWRSVPLAAENPEGAEDSEHRPSPEVSATEAIASPGGCEGESALAYRWESLGATLAGLVLTALLALAGGIFGAIRTALLAGVASALAAELFLPREGCAPRPLTAAAIALSAVLAFAPLDPALESARWARALPGYTLRVSRDSPYGRIAALESPGGLQLAIFENGAPVACVEPLSPADDTRFLADLVACLHPAPRRACVVGGTLAAFPSRLAEHGLETVDAVELDPALVELAALAGAGGGPSVRRLVEDGRSLLRRTAVGRYDLVVVFPGEPDSSTSSRFCSVEFFRTARGALSPDGVMVLFLPAYGAALEYQLQALARRSAAVYAAMREVFEEVRAAPVAGHMLIGYTSRVRADISPRALGARLASRERRPPEIASMLGGDLALAHVYFSALFGGALAESALPSEAGEASQELVLRLERSLADSRVPASRDERATVVTESLVLGGELRGGAWLVRWMRRLALPAAALPAALVAVLGVAAHISFRKARSGRSERATRLLVAFATGLFGMTVETAILWSYQAARGCVYSELGGIVASFMAGLALGAALGERVGPGRESRFLAAIAAAMAVVAAFVVPILRASSAFAPLYWLLAAAAGALDGATFPLLVAHPGRHGSEEGADKVPPPLETGRRSNARMVSAVSGIYAADLAGSAMGAALAGAVWIPALGLAGAGAASAAAVAVAGALLAPGIVLSYRRAQVG